MDDKQSLSLSKLEELYPNCVYFPYAVDNTVIEFEQPSYEILEDVGLNNFALRVCINIFNLTTERSVKLSTLSGTARGN